MHLLSNLWPLLVVFLVIKLISAPFRLARRFRGPGGGYGYRRRRFAGLGTIVFLVALDRLLGGRRF